MHAIKTTVEFPDVSYLAKLGKSRRLLHKSGLFLEEDSVEEGSLYVILSEAPVVDCGNVEDDMKRF